MSGSSFTELLKTLTKDEALDKLISYFRLGGFPVASWQPLSIPRQISEGLGEYLADLSVSVQEIAKSGINRYAFGAWLDILSEGYYGNTRQSAVVAQGYVTFTDSASVGPITRTNNPVWFELGGKRFKTIADFTVPLNGSVTLVACEAESEGSAFNVPLNSTGILVTSIPGITVSNPDPGDNNGTWLTRQGSDDESDLELQDRNELRWSALNVAATADTYKYWVLTLAPSVARVSVIEDQLSSLVDLYLAGPAGALTTMSNAEENALYEYVELYVRPLGSRVRYNFPTNVTCTISGNYFVSSDVTLAKALEDVTAAIVTLFGAATLGGTTIYLSEIIAAIQNVDGITHVNLTSPVADFTPAIWEVAVPSVAGLVGSR